MNKNNGLIGFINLGNTCYMNSALQCIRYTIPLSQYFFNNNIISNNKLTNSYINLSKKSWTFNGQAIKPINFKNNLGSSNKRFSGFSQQDSQEMIIHLLDTMHESLKLDNNKSIISNTFYGKFKQTIHCPNCKYNSITYQHFTDLAVPLVSSKLSDCFNYFTTEEELDSDNLYKCDKCKQHVKAIKKMELDILPNCLIVTLKRFNKRQKLTNHIDFPLKGFNVLNQKYDLYATVNHFGGKNGGHYTANVKHPNGNWYNMNDSRCSKINSNNIVNNSVYIAFFQKI